MVQTSDFPCCYTYIVPSTYGPFVKTVTMDTTSRTVTYYPDPEEFMWRRTTLSPATIQSRSVPTPKSVMYSQGGSNLPFNLGPGVENLNIAAIHRSRISTQKCAVDLIKSFPEFF